ncbi:hypothetical protein HPB48_023087 [Haemaphysalis longicornis]|uniref:Uncharacterized protein n=1 Tax=Haemaphysalis longicornis TaxID=44386 RepID=A0A9J6GAS4_HAELO|nr:hypothetical protein HPB48_023087 [Haemaphysalis longicornis]
MHTSDAAYSSYTCVRFNARRIASTDDAAVFVLFLPQLTLHLIWTYTAMVPLVDCSEVANVRTDLTELEKDVCQATAGFQNFVLQLMDK